MSATLAGSLTDGFQHAINPDSFFEKNALAVIRDKHELREQPIMGIPGESCKTNLFFGFFFDGTKNNYIQAEGAEITRQWRDCTIVTRA